MEQLKETNTKPPAEEERKVSHKIDLHRESYQPKGVEQVIGYKSNYDSQKNLLEEKR